MTLAEALSIRVNELLKSKNITPYRLSVLSGISQTSISEIRHMRNKSVNLATICEIAHAFNMDLSVFFNSPIFSYENITD